MSDEPFTCKAMWEQFHREAAECGMTFDDYFESLVTPESIAQVLDRIVRTDDSRG